MRYVTLLFFIIISPAIAVAQSGFNYHQFSIGAGAGTTTAYGSIGTADGKYAYTFNLNYHLSPYATITAELQEGTLAGGQITDESGRRFSNDYSTILLHADIQLGEVVDYSRSPFLNGLKNAYIGAGMGILVNNIGYIQVKEPVGAYDNATGIYPYLATSTNFAVPVRVGYEFKMYDGWDRPRYRLDFGYTVNTAFGRGLDGYVTSAEIKYYTYFYVAFKVGFGGVATYRKPINPFF